MNRTLRAFPFDGISTDSLGHYLAGLGLFAATARRWPTIRACWHRGRFMLLSDHITAVDEIKQYLLAEWTPTPYDRWWYKAQLTKVPGNIWKVRNERSAADIRSLDAHIVPMLRNCFNPVFGTGGNVAKRNFAEVWKNAVKLLNKPEKGGWLDATLAGRADCCTPDLRGGGTWFVFANKTFNSGQGWHREGQLSPWSFLLSMEGACLLIGGVNRRLGSRSRPYAVFPFVSDPSQPETDGEIGLARAEFWAPLWKNPATLGEVEMLLHRGLARLGGRAAQAPHEFAAAALATGVDAGVTEFARYELRQTTSSQVFEAIPREHIEAAPEQENGTGPQNGGRAVASKLLLALIGSGWLDRLPYEPCDSKQKGKFVGLRGPIEAAIVRIGERPNDATRWQALLLKLANAQARIDRNKTHRERCAALRPLDPGWFDLAWPKSDGISAEIKIARAIASIGWPCNAKTGDLPLLANVFGVEVTVRGRCVNVRLPKARTAQAVWGNGTPLQLLLDVAHRRLIDADEPDSRPLAATYCCSADAIYRLLRNDDSMDLEEVIRWVPALSLIDWSRRPRPGTVHEQPARSSVELDGTMLLQGLVRPLFHCRKLTVWNDDTRAHEPLFPQKFKPSAGLLRRVFNLLRFNSLDEAIQVLRDRYLAAGRGIVMPSAGFEANGELVAASLLIPISDQAVVNGFRRWLQPSKRRSN
jgi:CRISPR-associated protein Csx17